jgi:hypothetical protein
MPYDIHAVTELAKKHPAESAVVVIGGGVVILWLLGFFSSGSSSSAGGTDPNLASAFYAAQAQEAASGNALQTQEVNATAATAIAQIQGNVATTNATTWANTDLAMTQSNNQAATAGAPYAVEQSAISAFAQIAALPPVTTQTKNSGFLGIGASKNITQTPNPIAINASQNLSTLINGLYASH